VHANPDVLPAVGAAGYLADCPSLVSDTAQRRCVGHPAESTQILPVCPVGGAERAGLTPTLDARWPGWAADARANVSSWDHGFLLGGTHSRSALCRHIPAGPGVGLGYAATA